MGDRGPAPDPDQAAKGNPGRRKSKADRVALKAAELAKLLAPVANARADLPAMLQDLKYAPAAEVWRKLAPELKRTHRLQPESELIFIQFCIYMQEWVEATEDLHMNGSQQSIKTVAGGRMERRRPKTFDRQQAFANITDLSSRFGLTPSDMYGLFKDQAMAVARNPGLFDPPGAAPRAPGAEPAEPEAEPVSHGGRIGGMDRYRAAPPTGPKPN